MVYYSITDLEKITGVKAHTIRIWEKRYNIVCPIRTSTNIRCYTDTDLRKLLNISLLNRYGYRISSLVKMPLAEISDLVVRITANATDHASQIENLMLSMIELNEEKFEKTLSNSFIKLGFEKTVISVIYPFLEKVGLLWQVGSITTVHEHFISNLIRQKLIIAIDGLLPSYNAQTKTFVLFLPPNELHELSLLFFYYLIKQMGHKVIYLGQTVPLNDVELICQAHSPYFIFTVITASLTLEQYNNLINELSETFADKTIFVSGYQVREHSIDLPANITAVSNSSQFHKVLSEFI